jgi:hypothetical protein
MHNASATKILNLSKKSGTFKEEDDEEFKTDPDMEPTNPDSKKKDPNVLSSSD